jgi:hypothetical protein
MASVFLHSRDAHGLHDMGVEIQGIQWAIRELEKASVPSTGWKLSTALIAPSE